MVKRVRRLVRGQTEVARICGESRRDMAAPVQHSPAMTKALWQEWSTSAKLRPLFEQFGKREDMLVDHVVQTICQEKRIAPPQNEQVVANLTKCLTDIKAVNIVIATVKMRAAETFDSSNERHEQSLEHLWQLLLPGQERDGGRYSKEWSRIGFQQSDPASDFRGGGVLGLEQLIFIASSRTNIARNMIKEPKREEGRYPWACVGINLTMEAIKILEGRKIDETLYGKSLEEALNVFHGLYADMFEILHHRWLKEGAENVLAFPPVLKDTFLAIHEEIDSTAMLVPPGALA